MTLSRQTIEILLDLIEIKMSSLQVQDREDARELTKLRKCRQELLATYVQALHKNDAFAETITKCLWTTLLKIQTELWNNSLIFSRTFGGAKARQA